MPTPTYSWGWCMDCGARLAPFCCQVFDLMSPLHQLGRARWSLLHGMDKVAEKALDLGLVISEEVSEHGDCSLFLRLRMPLLLRLLLLLLHC